MNAVDIAVIVAVGIAAVVAVGYLVYKRIKHKGGCCDCSACGRKCSRCKTQKDGE